MLDMNYLRRLAGITEVTDREMAAGRTQMQLDAVMDAHAACVQACDRIKPFYDALKAIEDSFGDADPPKEVAALVENVSQLLSDLQPFAKGTAHKQFEKAKAKLQKELRDYQ